MVAGRSSEKSGEADRLADQRPPHEVNIDHETGEQGAQSEEDGDAVGPATRSRLATLKIAPPSSAEPVFAPSAERTLARKLWASWCQLPSVKAATSEMAKMPAA